MKRALHVAALVTALVLLAGMMPAGAVHNFLQNSRLCDTSPQYRGTSAVADGPFSQLDVHSNVFIPAYARLCGAAAGPVTYLGRGERAGLDAFIDHVGTRHLNTADLPLSTVEWLQAWFDLRSPNRRNRTSTLGIHQIPLYVNILAVGYRLSSCNAPQLRLRSPVLGLIFSGQITQWSHALIVQDNPALASCAAPIRLIKRAEFAGSTYTFKDYLSKRTPFWNYYKQPAQNQVWPSIANSCPGVGDDGIAECISSTQDSIGYLSYHEAKIRGIKTAHLDNPVSSTAADPAARFIAPSPAACTEAASSAIVFPPIPEVSVPGEDIGTLPVSPTIGDWSTVSLTDARQGYPLCSFSYAFVFGQFQSAYHGQQYPASTGRTVVDYLWAAVGEDGQKGLAGYDYARLPDSVSAAAKQGLEAVRFAG